MTNKIRPSEKEKFLKRLKVLMQYTVVVHDYHLKKAADAKFNEIYALIRDEVVPLIPRADDPVGDFIKSKATNAWLNMQDKMVYVRKGVHFHPVNGIITTFDIASITVYEPKTGAFTRLVLEIFQKSDVEFVYVESVLNEDFAKTLRSKGYVEQSHPPSFFISRATFQN